MSMLLFILYIMNGLMVAIWYCVDTIKRIIEHLEETPEGVTNLQKIWLVISAIDVAVLVTAVWPAWMAVLIYKMYVD